MISTTNVHSLSGVEGNALWYSVKGVAELPKHIASSVIHDPKVDEATQMITVEGKEEGERERGKEEGEGEGEESGRIVVK